MISERVEEQAARVPRQEALVWRGGRLLYEDLNAQANQLAHRLLTRGVHQGASVGVLLPRTADLVITLLAVLKAGGTYVPLDPAFPAARLAAIMSDARPACLITDRTAAPCVPEASRGRALVLDDERALIAEASAANLAQTFHPQELAYVIYTSGSTGRPKGVAITHGSAAAFLDWVRSSFSARELRGMAAVTSIAFDLSIFELFGALAWGGRVLLADHALALGELPWRDEIRLVNTVPSAMAELLALGALPRHATTVCLAGEPFPAALLPRLRAAGIARILNLYGPTEDTTYSTYAELDDEGPPPIGRPLPGRSAYVLDGTGAICPAGVAGELYLGGGGLARGYVGNAIETAARFLPDPFSSVPGSRLYRTGDRARWRPDGQLEHLGRLDRQVKLRGFRIELGEIEHVIGATPGVDQCAVAIRSGPQDDPRVVAYVTGVVDAEAIQTRAARLLPGYMVPSAIVPLPALPRLPNGKRDDNALPTPSHWLGRARAADGEGTAWTSTIEQQIARVWRDLLGHEAFDRHGHFLDHGGHSLLATRMLARLRGELDGDLSLTDIFTHPTIAQLAARIGARASGSTPRVAAIPRLAGRAAPLSASQRQVWFHSRLDPLDSSYNVPCAIRITGPVEPATLERAMRRIQQRHTVLRTRIEEHDGVPAQIVDVHSPIELVVERVEGDDRDARWAAACRRGLQLADQRIDLSRAPLLRAVWTPLTEMLSTEMPLSNSESVLIVVVHHLVFDAWSLAVLVRDLAACYTAIEMEHGEPDPPRLDFASFCAWQARQDWREGLAYWRTSLRGAPVVLDLPTDHPRPARADAQGGSAVFDLAPHAVGAIERVARRQGATSFMAMLAAFQVWLGGLTGQRDFIVGTAVAGRTVREVDDVIGCFINMVPLRATLIEGGFVQHLGRVREVVLGSLRHQDVPFELVLDHLRPPRDARYTPLIQVAFGLENGPRPYAEHAGRAFEGIELRPDRARLDLTVWLTPPGTSGGTTRGWRAMWTYRSDLFTRTTIAQWHRQYEDVLRRVAAAPLAPLATGQSAIRRTVMADSPAARKFPARQAPKTVGADDLATLAPDALGPGLPALVRTRAPGVSLSVWTQAHRSVVEENLRTRGGLLFRGFEMPDLPAFQAFSRTLSSEVIRYGERSSPRTQLADGVYTSTDHPPDQPIVLHNEQSYTLNWPMRIAFFCARPAARHGRTPIADSRRILRRLSASTIRRFEELGVLYVRNYLPGVSLSWTEAFQTSSRDDVETYCRSEDVEVEWVGGERLRTRQRRAAIRTHPVTQERVWFNHALFFHVSSLPAEVSRSLQDAVAEEDLPYNSYYGDGTRIEADTLRELREAYEAETASFDWQAQDVLLLDNMLIAHGRQPFEGPREVRVAMVDPYAVLYGRPQSGPAPLTKEVG